MAVIISRRSSYCLNFATAPSIVCQAFLLSLTGWVHPLIVVFVNDLDAQVVCWWCKKRAADSKEHKFKASDLRRAMFKGDPEAIVWMDDKGTRRDVRGRKAINRDRHKVLKFEPSLCKKCNNEHSQSFDLAYDQFAEYIATNPGIHDRGYVSFSDIFGRKWRSEMLNVARYFIKHFGCRMVSDGVPVPESMVTFLNGATEMDDVRLNLVCNEQIRCGALPYELWISQHRWIQDEHTREVVASTCAYYILEIGVRFEWGGNPMMYGKEWEQFFDFSRAHINYYLDDKAVIQRLTVEHDSRAQ